MEDGRWLWICVIFPDVAIGNNTSPSTDQQLAALPRNFLAGKTGVWPSSSWYFFEAFFLHFTM